jgi:hypothetical protein
LFGHGLGNKCALTGKAMMFLSLLMVSLSGEYYLYSHVCAKRPNKEKEHCLLYSGGVISFLTVIVFVLICVEPWNKDRYATSSTVSRQISLLDLEDDSGLVIV